MFQLTKISDLIRIPPHLFNLSREKALKQELHVKYANKIIPKVGFVIAVWDIINYEKGLFKPGDGAMYITVEFHLVVFRPFVGEVLTGWIEECKADGLKINMGFFNDIFIPRSLLFENANFHPEDNAWIWEMDEETKLYLDVNEKINFRVEELIFTNVKPVKPGEESNTADGAEMKTPSFAIIASAQTDGMGCCSWWE